LRVINIRAECVRIFQNFDRIGNIETMTKAAAKRLSRDKKRILVRQQLQQLNIDHRNFRRLCAGHIRAIRYLRLRNQELAMLDVLLRLQSCMRSRLGLVIQQQQQQPGQAQQQDRQRGRNNTTIKLVEWQQPRD
jgi:transcription initiation factor TFIID subunit TAF12